MTSDNKNIYGKQNKLIAYGISLIFVLAGVLLLVTGNTGSNTDGNSGFGGGDSGVTCTICGSTEHGVYNHPKCTVCGKADCDASRHCSVCGSLEHTKHPTCPKCGSTDHTVHPKEKDPGNKDEVTERPGEGIQVCKICGGNHDESECPKCGICGGDHDESMCPYGQ